MKHYFFILLLSFLCSIKNIHSTILSKDFIQRYGANSPIFQTKLYTKKRNDTIQHSEKEKHSPYSCVKKKRRLQQKLKKSKKYSYAQ